MNPDNKEETVRGISWTEEHPLNSKFSNLTSEKKNARKESVSALSKKCREQRQSTQRTII